MKSMFHADETLFKKTTNLKRFLSIKLAEFLDSKFLYRLRRITSLEKKKLYIGPCDGTDDTSTGAILNLFLYPSVIKAFSISRPLWA